jgi:hypothetical protein
MSVILVVAINYMAECLFELIEYYAESLHVFSARDFKQLLEDSY